MLQHLIIWAFQLSILATAFGFGLKATTEDVQDLIRRPALLGRSFLAIFVIVPIVAVALAHAAEVRSPMPRRRPSFWMRARRQSTTSRRDAWRRTISLPRSSRTRPAA